LGNKVDITFFIRGFLIGFAIAAPVGPIGVLCIRRTLAHGRAAGLLSGLGAATADAAYGMVAGLGLTSVSALLVSQQNGLQLAGGLFLGYLGIKSIRAQPAAANTEAPQNRRGAFASTFLLTLTNPATILSFTAIFAGAGLAHTGGNYFLAGWLVLGVFCGSAGWWLALTGAVSLFRRRFNRRAMVWVNRAAGVFIGGFGLLMLASLL